MTVVNKFNVNREQVTLDADIIENMSANDVSYNASTQYDDNTVGDKLSKLESELNNLTNSVVKCTTQEFSEDEKSIARNNIDASKKKTVDTYIEQEQTAIMQGTYKKQIWEKLFPKVPL